MGVHSVSYTHLVIDTRGMEADFTVLENELAFIKTGDKVMITPYAGGDSVSYTHLISF